MIIREQFKSEAALVLVAVIWGGTFPVIKGGLNDSSPLLLVAIRFFAAFLFFLPVIIKRRAAINKNLVKAVFFLGLSMFVGYGLLTVGLTMTTVAKSSFISYGYALITPFLQFLMLRKKVNPVNLVGLGIAFTGMLIFTSPDASGWNTGDTLTLVVAFGYAFNVILLDKYTRLFDIAILSGGQFLVVSVLSFIFVPFLETPYIVPGFELYKAMFYLIIPGTVGALYMMNRFQKGTTPVRAVIIYALEPVVAVILGFVFLHEQVGWQEAVGGVVILSGVLFSEIHGLFVPAPVRS